MHRLIFSILNFYEQLKFHAQLSCLKKSFITSGDVSSYHCPYEVAHCDIVIFIKISIKFIE